MFMKKFIFLVTVIFTSNIYANSDIYEFINRVESKSSSFHNFAFAVIKDGEVIHKSTHGYLKIREKKQVDHHSMFSVASVSKSITALAIAKLVDEGRLNFDETVVLPCLKNPTTLREILSQTTGYKFTGNADLNNNINRTQLLKKLQQQNPVCKSCYFYSNTVFSLVDEVLQQKGMSLEYAINNLNKALNTNEIQLAPVNKDLDIVSRHKRRKVLAVSNYQLTVPAAAGVYVSLDAGIEVLKVISGVKKDVISKDTLDQIFTIHVQNNDVSKFRVKFPRDIKSYYGLGFRILKNQNESTMIFHSGHINGMFAFIGFIPNKNIGVIFMESGKKFKQNIHILEDLIKLGLD